MPSDVSIPLALALDRKRRAGQRGHAVDEHRARAAGAAVAHLLGVAGQPHGFEQRLAQRPMGLHLHLEVHAVDGQRGGGRNGGLRVRFLEVLHEGI